QDGDFETFNIEAFGVIAFIRRDSKRVVAYIGQIADAWHRFDSVLLNVSAIARAAGARQQVRLTNLLGLRSTVVNAVGGGFRVQLNQLGIDEHTRFCLLEASSA
ncbi:MAG TPA: hypothetical protein VK747_21315, partial [Blastocatellia bacterium]|nr:hypothetical protein [Blastocatellia bacterium]